MKCKDIYCSSYDTKTKDCAHNMQKTCLFMDPATPRSRGTSSVYKELGMLSATQKTKPKKPYRLILPSRKEHDRMRDKKNHQRQYRI